MTQCLNCNSPFVHKIKNFGHLQLYCSTKCANRERHKRYIQRKSAEITEQIACDFAQWVERNKLDSSGKYLHLFHLSYKELFQEYLKSKENETKN